MRLNFLPDFLDVSPNLIINLKIFQFQSKRHSISCTFAVPYFSGETHFNKLKNQYNYG